MLEITWLGILVGSAAYMALGAFWYSFKFLGKAWMVEVGKKEKDLKDNSNPRLYLATFLSIVVAVFVLSQVMVFAQAATIGEALQTALWVWLGFVAATSVINSLFAGRTLKLWMIETGYHLAGLALASLAILYL
jgi:hypothetical protein